MKVLILTRHAVPNYGSLYQSYALQQTVEKLGFEAVIIDAEYSYYDASQISKDAMVTSKFKNIPFLSQLSYLVKYHRYKKPIEVFRRYQIRWLNLSNQFIVREDFYNDFPDADVYMIGSDQVWNIMPDGDIEPMYFLDFVPAEKKKVSYAASFGSLEKIEHKIPIIQKYLSLFNAITVREDDGISILERMNLNGRQVLDPTLLLTAEQWSQLAEDDIELPEEYILLYQVNHNKDLCKKAEQIAKKKKIALIRVTNDCSEIFWSKGFTYLPTPGEFLTIIKRAKYVITDSFHGTCFCINYNKNFVVVFPERYSQRNQSILRLFGLTDRAVRENDFSIMEKEIDWNRVNRLLDHERIDSTGELIHMLLKK